MTDREGHRSDKWRSILYAYFLRRVQNKAVAEDLTHEVLLRILEKEQATSAVGDGYVFATASNLLKDRARKHKVRRTYLETQSADDSRNIEELDPFRVVAGRLELAEIIAVLERLPPRTRNIFLLYRVERVKLSVIAENYGLSRSAAKYHLAKALAALVEAVETPHG